VALVVQLQRRQAVAVAVRQALMVTAVLVVQTLLL